jgi:Xaa-Pro aminopeptidase
VYDARVSRLREKLSQPVLISFLPNIRYFTGFTGSNAYLLVGDDRFTFVTDGRYAELAGTLIEAIAGADLVVYRSGLTDVLSKLLSGYQMVGVESEHLAWSMARELAGKSEARLIATTGTVEELRAVKDDHEVASLAAAAAVGDAAFAQVPDLAAAAATEGDLAWSLIEAMRGAGGSQAGWRPIVAAGPNASLPHHLSERGALGSGLLLLDYGCTVDGYHSDMSRTIWLSGTPDAETERMYRAVLESQQAGIDAVAPGVTGHEVDEACRAVLRGYGYEELFVHSTGHGVGLEIHEAPRVAKDSGDVLVPGNVVTVEPGVYRPGFGGVRIEDMVVVTASGRESLTASDKELCQQ